MDAKLVSVFSDRRAMSGAGGKLESPNIEFGDGSDAKLKETLMASVSQHQREKNRKQTIHRLRARLMNGDWVFHPPLGMKTEKVAGHGKLLVRDEPVASYI